MQYTLGLVVVPVSDVDRAKPFDTGGMGLRVAVDHSACENFRVVQPTTPGGRARSR